MFYLKVQHFGQSICINGINQNKTEMINMKNITTKLLTLGISAVLITGCLTACKVNNSGKIKVNINGEEVLNTEIGIGTGSWKVAESMVVTEELKKYFDEAISKLDGYNHTPVLLLGTQVVAGTNYCFLTTSTIQANNAAKEMKLTYINVDPSGSANFIKDTVLKLPGVGEGGEKVGGWAYAESTVITDDIFKVMEKATETLTGATYEPVAYIGSQVVAGTNHAILCKSTPSVAELNGATTYVLVYVYEDLQGKCEITETTDVVLSID